MPFFKKVMAVRCSSRAFCQGYVTQTLDIHWVERLWTPFNESLKLQIDVRTVDCRHVTSALLRSEALLLYEAYVYKNVFRSNATSPRAHRSCIMVGIRKTPVNEWALLIKIFKVIGRVAHVHNAL
eukprot:13752928-Heterocapsa_arctica.AAC.1